jgi:hypothetical protein
MPYSVFNENYFKMFPKPIAGIFGGFEKQEAR